MPDVEPGAQSWAVVVPVKRLAVAKTRLSLDPDLRRELALAMASDTVAACVAARNVVAVLVVTDDEDAGPAMAALGAQVVGDEPDAGLNPALAHGAAVLASRHPHAGVAALSSDLPALTGAALEELLGRAVDVAAGCVADASGTGTTVLTARAARSLVPAFGAGSWQRHLDGGAADLTPYADPRLRRDVDTTADLTAALRLGCGPATVTVVTAHPALLQ
jgi:2-phospho-L-lactate guanylyltransferase